MAIDRVTESDTADREIAVTRVFDAPRELLWKVWTDPNHLTEWWGPRGFITTTFSMEPKPGGEWRFVMHGPDGVDYRNRITYVEVVEPARIVYRHDGEAGEEPVRFEVTVTFTDLGGRTEMSMRMVFPSAAEKRRVAEEYGAEQGLYDTVARLGEHLPRVAEAEEDFVIARSFDAPRDVVWRAWTERERLEAWFGPKGFPIAECSLDLRPGGAFHYCLRSPQGQEMWGKWVFREVTPPQRLVFVSSFSDPSGAVVRAPFSETWPLETRTTIVFAERDGRTVLTLRGSVCGGTPEERATWVGMHGSMRQGWGGTFELLADYLAKG